MPRQLRAAGEAVLLPNLATVFGRTSEVSASRRFGDQELLTFDGYRAFGYGSGTEALAAGLLVAVATSNTLHPEVIIPAYACPDIVSAAMLAGVKPVLADLLPESAWLDPVSVANSLSLSTVAVVYVRFLGLPANDQALRSAIAKSRALLIEDRAHVFPAEGEVKSAADLLVTSFGRGKPVSLRGGGLLHQRLDACRSAPPPVPSNLPDSRRQRAVHWCRCALYNIAIRPRAYWWLTRFFGVPVEVTRYRRTRALRGFPQWLISIAPRSIQGQRGDDNWREARIESILSEGDGWIDLAKGARKDAGSASIAARLWRYPLLLKTEAERDRLYSMLWKAGLGASRMYQQVLSDFPGTVRYVRGGDNPRAREFAQRLLTLPLHSDVLERDIDQLGNCLRSFART